MAVQPPEKLGQQIIKALGLPEYTESFKIEYHINSIPTITCTHFILDMDHKVIRRLASKFEITKISEEET